MVAARAIRMLDFRYKGALNERIFKELVSSRDGMRRRVDMDDGFRDGSSGRAASFTWPHLSSRSVGWQSSSRSDLSARSLGWQSSSWSDLSARSLGWQSSSRSYLSARSVGW